MLLRNDVTSLLILVFLFSIINCYSIIETTFISQFNFSLFPPSTQLPPPYNASNILDYCSTHVHNCRYDFMAIPSDRFFSFFWTLFPYHRVGPESNFPVQYYSKYNKNNYYFTDLCSLWKQVWYQQTLLPSNALFYYKQVNNSSCTNYYNLFVKNNTIINQLQKTFFNESSTIGLAHETKQYFCSYCVFDEVQEFELLFPRSNNSLLITNEQLFGEERFCFTDIPRWLIKNQSFPSQLCYCSKYNKFMDVSYSCDQLAQIFTLEDWFLIFNWIRLPISLFNLLIALIIITIPTICKSIQQRRWKNCFSLKLISIYLFSFTCVIDALQNITIICESIWIHTPLFNGLSQIFWFSSRLSLWFTLIILLSLWHKMSTHYKNNDTVEHKQIVKTSNSLKSRSSSVFSFVEEAYSSPVTAKPKPLHQLREDYDSSTFPIIKSTSLQQIFTQTRYQKSESKFKTSQTCEILKTMVVALAFLYVIVLQVSGVVLEILVYFVSGGRLLDHIYEAYNLCLNILLSISYLLVLFSYPLVGVLILKWMRTMQLWNWYYRFFIFLISITPTYVIYWMLHLLTTLNAFNEDPIITFIFKICESCLYKIQIWLLLLLLMNGTNLNRCCKSRKKNQPVQQISFAQDFMNSFEEQNSNFEGQGEKKPLLVRS